MKQIADCLIIPKENKYTGKPISASIKEIYEHYFYPITWSQAYADGIGICKPPTNDDIRYEYPDGKEYRDPPTEPGKYKAKITVCDPETPTRGATLVEEFEILKPEKSKLNTIRELVQKIKKN